MQPAQPGGGQAPMYAPQYAPQAPAPMPAAPTPMGGGGGLAKALSVVAVLLAVAALAINFVIPGPAGATGAAGSAGAKGATGATGATGGTGAQGPPGPAALMATDTSGGGPTIAATGCTHSTGAEVTISPTVAGTVVVTSQVRLTFNHVAGQSDWARVFLGTSDTDCTADDWRAWAEVPSGVDAGTVYMTVTVQKAFPVAAPGGSFTYYVNGDWLAGTGTASFSGSGTTAVFYPS